MEFDQFSVPRYLFCSPSQVSLNCIIMKGIVQIELYVVVVNSTHNRVDLSARARARGISPSRYYPAVVYVVRQAARYLERTHTRDNSERDRSTCSVATTSWLTCVITGVEARPSVRSKAVSPYPRKHHHADRSTAAAAALIDVSFLLQC